MATRTKEQPAIKTTHETRMLKCRLTAEEITEASDALARNLDELEMLEDAQQEMKSNFKAQIEAKEAATRVQKNLVRDKYTLRLVRCTLTMNYTTLKVIVARDDTGEVVSERAMNEDEKQLKIDFDKQQEDAA